MSTNTRSLSPSGNGVDVTGCQLPDDARLVVVASCQVLKLVGHDTSAILDSNKEIDSAGVWASAQVAVASTHNDTHKARISTHQD